MSDKSEAHFGPNVKTGVGMCPSCGRSLTGATAVSIDGPVDHPMPKPEDCTICLYCGAVLIFNSDLTLRHPNAEERAEIDETLPEVKQMLAWQALASGQKPS